MAPRIRNSPSDLSSTRTLRSSSSSPSQPHKYIYNVAASYIAKDHPYDPATHIFHFNPYNRVQRPDPSRGAVANKASRPDSGQDAFFVSRIGDSPGSVALGVADGVGGWMDSGVDPADFSHAFCGYMAAEAHEHLSPEDKKKPPKTTTLTARELMQRGYDAACRDPSIKAGGSTAIVGLLDGTRGVLEVANLGDSGFVHLRPNCVHARSPPQTHAFNTPFQLSVIPPSMMLRAARFGGARLCDLPRDADVTRHNLRHGDVLVFASDGLWDNLFDQDVLRIVSGAMTRTGAWASSGEDGVRVAEDLTSLTQLEGQEEKGKPEAVTLQSLLATEIVAAAKAASVNQRLNGPFAKEVKKYYPHENWSGGKVDDICVIVVVVSETGEPVVRARL
ncbi:5-azacytidine resistance protein azr1 [Coniochaeta sp. 2T2.1]|nr:5-azacytidine resistance protein azr1 [Coniochaeta sp. 2T2.1]